MQEIGIGAGEFVEFDFEASEEFAVHSEAEQFCDRRARPVGADEIAGGQRELREPDFLPERFAASSFMPQRI